MRLYVGGSQGNSIADFDDMTVTALQ